MYLSGTAIGTLGGGETTILGGGGAGVTTTAALQKFVRETPNATAAHEMTVLKVDFISTPSFAGAGGGDSSIVH